MRDTDGGGGHAGTNWSATSVIDMWLAIANQDTTPHWQLLSGWRKSYELTLQHMAQVKNYRENLATAWPPEKSPAAAAYIARLDVLIEHLQQTYDAAVANHQAFSTATAALSTARRDLEKVVNEYLANEGKLQAFAREQAERPKGGLQRGAEPKPPVADGQQAQLEAKARGIMYGLSSEISQARVQITKPALYEPFISVNDEGHESGGISYSAPPVPPVTPFTPGSGASTTSSPSSVASTHGVQASTVTPGPTPPSMRQPGLILGGSDSPVPPPPPPLTPSTPAVGNPAPSPAFGPGLLPQPPLAPNLVPPPNVSPGFIGVTPPPNVSPGNGGMRAMPPGGIIGGNPAMGLGQPVSGNRSIPSVNPVGGMINPGSPGTGRTVGGHGVPVTGMPPSRAHGASDDEKDRPRWDPDNPWETAKGVPPVVTPRSEQRVDPGPAIGLH